MYVFNVWELIPVPYVVILHAHAWLIPTFIEIISPSVDNTLTYMYIMYFIYLSIVEVTFYESPSWTLTSIAHKLALCMQRQLL